jgi:hypothetical protein
MSACTTSSTSPHPPAVVYFRQCSVNGCAAQSIQAAHATLSSVALVTSKT